MIDDDFRAQLDAVPGSRGVLDAAALKGREGGFHPDNLAAGLAVAPSTPEAVAAICALCHKHGVAIVPHGGLTGLAGGAASTPGQLIVSTARLKEQIAIDPDGRTALVSAGSTLHELNEAAAAHGLSCGIDIAARGTATIGGMIATNAGGSEAFRHGIMRNRVLGLEAVTGTGLVMSDMKKVSKANEGLDIKQLFIGSEGTLGIITRAVMRLELAIEHDATLIVSCKSAAQALRIFNKMRACAGCILLKGEIMWQRYATVTAQELGLSAVLPDARSPVQVIFEAAGDGIAPNILLERMAGILEEEDCGEVFMAQSERERADIWLVREDSWAIERRYPRGLWFDVSVPLGDLDRYVHDLEARIAGIDSTIAVFVMGHLGDGNLHLTISRKPSLDELYPEISAAVYDGLSGAGGSFSAEHGIGVEKMGALVKYGDPGKLTAMRLVKQALDPGNIMNPGKVFPSG